MVFWIVVCSDMSAKEIKMFSKEEWMGQYLRRRDSAVISMAKKKKFKPEAPQIKAFYATGAAG